MGTWKEVQAELEDLRNKCEAAEPELRRLKAVGTKLVEDLHRLEDELDDERKSNRALLASLREKEANIRIARDLLDDARFKLI